MRRDHRELSQVARLAGHVDGATWISTATHAVATIEIIVARQIAGRDHRGGLTDDHACECQRGDEQLHVEPRPDVTVGRRLMAERHAMTRRRWSSLVHCVHNRATRLGDRYAGPAAPQSDL